MTSQEGSSLLKSCARRSFSFTCGNLQAFATHLHSLGDPLLGRNPWFEKICTKQRKDHLISGCLYVAQSLRVSYNETHCWLNTTAAGI